MIPRPNADPEHAPRAGRRGEPDAVCCHRVLILGGTTEGSGLARRIGGEFAPILSLAGRTAHPVLPDVAHRIGGFGGVDGLAAYLDAHAIDLIVDATHPYATRMSANAISACRRTGRRLLRIERPAWTPSPGDRWTAAPDLQHAAQALGPSPRRVLLTVGRQELAPFRAAPQHSYTVRSVDAPDPVELPRGAVVIAARGPFTRDGEAELLRRHRIQAIVTKNSGGDAVRAKLHAARDLGLAVVMIERPRPPAAAESVATVDEALAWLQRAASTARGV